MTARPAVPYLCTPVSCLNQFPLSLPSLPSSCRSSAPGLPWLDPRQPHFCQQANQAGRWQGQMAGGAGGDMGRSSHPPSTSLLQKKEKKTSVSSPPMLPLWMGSNSISIIFMFIILIKSALMHSNRTGIILPAGTGQRCAVSLLPPRDGDSMALVTASGRWCRAHRGLAVACRTRSCFLAVDSPSLFVLRASW